MKKKKREKEKIPEVKKNEDFEDGDLFFLLRILGNEVEDWEKRKDFWSLAWSFSGFRPVGERKDIVS